MIGFLKLFALFSLASDRWRPRQSPIYCVPQGQHDQHRHHHRHHQPHYQACLLEPQSQDTTLHPRNSLRIGPHRILLSLRAYLYVNTAKITQTDE